MNELRSRVFEAKRPGDCALCESRIERGDRVGFSTDGLFCHEECPQ